MAKPNISTGAPAANAKREMRALIARVTSTAYILPTPVPQSSNLSDPIALAVLSLSAALMAVDLPSRTGLDIFIGAMLRDPEGRTNAAVELVRMHGHLRQRK